MLRTRLPISPRNAQHVFNPSSTPGWLSKSTLRVFAETPEIQLPSDRFPKRVRNLIHDGDRSRVCWMSAPCCGTETAIRVVLSPSFDRRTISLRLSSFRSVLPSINNQLEDGMDHDGGEG